MKVLVIDDSELARGEMERVLEEAGHTVLSTGSPIGATRVIINEGVDAVVLDVNLPSMRGDKLMQLFRSNPRLASVSVVLISGMPQDELIRIAKDCKADAVVAKHQISAELHVALQEAQRRRRRVSSPSS